MHAALAREMNDLVALAAPAERARPPGPLDQHPSGAARPARKGAACRCASLSAKSSASRAAFSVLRTSSSELERGRVRPRRELEAEQARETDCTHELERGREILGCFARESHDHVGRERDPGHRVAQRFDAFAVLGHRVAADHASQHAIAAGLHGQMHVPGQEPRARRGRGSRIASGAADAGSCSAAARGRERARRSRRAGPRTRFRPRRRARAGCGPTKPAALRARSAGSAAGRVAVDGLPEQRDLAHARGDQPACSRR